MASHKSFLSSRWLDAASTSCLPPPEAAALSHRPAATSLALHMSPRRVAGAPAQPRFSSCHICQRSQLCRDRDLEGSFPGFPPHVSQGSTASLTLAGQPCKTCSPVFGQSQIFHLWCFPAELPGGQKRGQWLGEIGALRQIQANLQGPPAAACLKPLSFLAVWDSLAWSPLTSNDSAVQW